ncbi:hypothetical protein P691DRAFT_724688 [Macrolepiota fuliginosa MF-IS2]|uniref:Rhodopsin domain-containing protein n=1 Tax=Macrolepiota fuliginosa MF-IS2 TaxID=1400762 RepID=A0A9P6C7H7_9AGAR|nr:hypothetical protein P691DRAFT_724688 [Macrolepiota fuliginosa MF-IS2]
MSPFLSIPAWQGATSVFHALALTCTSFRLYRRSKMRNMWWDDYWALFAFVMDLALCTTIGLRREVGGGANAGPNERHRRIVLFWISGTLPPLIVWVSRISICFSIARMDIQHTLVRVRLWVYALTVPFGIIGGAMFCQKVWVCSHQTSWHHNPNIQCSVGNASGYISLTADLLADVILTMISFRFLWKVRMRRSRRRLLSWLFAANIWSSLAGILYGVLLLNANKLGGFRTPIVSLTIHIKATTTLTVCNLLVVVTYVYARFWKSSDDSDSESEASQTTRRHSNLPSGRTTKPSRDPQNTALVLTEFSSDDYTTSQSRGWREDHTSTFMTWAGSERGWLPRAPPPALTSGRSVGQASASVSSVIEANSPLHVLSRAVSAP